MAWGVSWNSSFLTDDQWKLSLKLFHNVVEVPVDPEKEKNLFLNDVVAEDDPANVPENNKTTILFSFNKSYNDQYFLQATAPVYETPLSLLTLYDILPWPSHPVNAAALKSSSWPPGFVAYKSPSWSS